MFRSFCRTVIPVPLLVASLVFPVSITAQVPDPVVAAKAPDPGSDHGYIGRGAETVNPADGQVTFDLPIQTPAGRQLTLPFGIRYSNEEAYALSTGGAHGGSFSWYRTPVAWGQGGWNYALPNLTWRSVVQAAAEYCTQTGYTGQGTCPNWE